MHLDSNFDRTCMTAFVILLIFAISFLSFANP